MKCAACGNENQPTAKFCVHCGVLLSPVSAPAPAAVATASAAVATAPPHSSARSPEPVPIAAVAAMAAPAPVPAAPAYVPPAPTPPSPAPASAEAAASAPVSVEEAVFAAPPSSDAPSSSKTPLIIGAVAIVVVIAIGFVGYRALYGGGGHEPVAAAEPPKASEPSATTMGATEPVKDAVAPPVAPAEAPSSNPAEEPPKIATASDGLPGTPVTPVKASTRSAQPKTASKTEPAIDSAPMPAPAVKAPPKATQVAAATSAAAQPDRWQMYADAMGRCAHEDFFKRFGCELRTRNQYCQGYWGQVPQCPEATPRDHGQ